SLGLRYRALPANRRLPLARQEPVYLLHPRSLCACTLVLLFGGTLVRKRGSPYFTCGGYRYLIWTAGTPSCMSAYGPKQTFPYVAIDVAIVGKADTAYCSAHVRL